MIRRMGMHVHQFGPVDAAPLLALHGVTGHGARFRRLSALLPNRVLAPDLRGHGRSPAPPPWTLERNAADLLAVLDEHGVETAPVVAHSFGGRVALELARSAPERVGALVLLDPAVSVSPGDALAYATSADVAVADREQALAFQRGNWPMATQDVLEEEIDANWVDVDGAWRPRYLPAAVATAWSEMCREPQAPPPGTRTLLVRATGADYVSPAYAAACGPHVGVVELDCGHMVLLERLERVAELITGFLR